jgi:hypothetical protein
MQWLTKELFSGFHDECHMMVFRILTPCDIISVFNKPIVIHDVRIQMPSFGNFFFFFVLISRILKAKEFMTGV